MDHSTVAVIISAVALLATLLKDVFSGGGKLSAKFSSLKEETTEKITNLRMEFIEKSDRNNSNSKVGFDAITANIHALQLGFQEFRAQMAENYMRRDSFYKATDELKRDFNDKHDDLKADVQRGFDEIKKELSAVAQSIEANRRDGRMPQPHM